MFQCIDCGSQNPYHACPKHPSFKIKEPGIVMTPRSIERLEEENARLLLQIDEIRKDFAIHSCPSENGFCWRCNAAEVVEKVLRRTEKRDVPVPVCAACRGAFPGHEPRCPFGGPEDPPEPEANS